MTTHRFEPTIFHNTFGSHQPVLSVKSGDVIATRTVDAAGRDYRDELVAERGNPLTGPFFVEGAQAGDALVVHIASVRPNRTRGFSSLALAPVAVEPGFVWDLERTQRRIDWIVDARTGSARPKEPIAGLEDLAVPLVPMLGCIGVAPEKNQHIASATSGPYGGNMDFRRLGAGVTMRFPVSVPGALLFVGDAHAAQGAGELAGTGIEVSADIELKVSVEKPDAPDERVRWPRGETQDAIFTLGNARPLDDAARYATTEMVRWLRSSYGLSPEASSVLIGQTCSYELGNMFDPAFTMACIVEKGFLP
ncbi:MAG: acetamidase/formamidase family protein [Trueperaceae bacterium]|nr:acetamidase/formamidase family protein [Trueperaceae bacterium]